MPYERLVFLDHRRHKLSEVSQDEHLRSILKHEKPDYFLRFISDATEEEKHHAVSRYGIGIKFIENPSEEIIMAAIKEDPYALLFIKNRTRDASRIALEKAPQLIKEIDNPTDEEIELVLETEHKNMVVLNFSEA